LVLRFVAPRNTAPVGPGAQSGGPQATDTRPEPVRPAVREFVAEKGVRTGFGDPMKLVAFAAAASGGLSWGTPPIGDQSASDALGLTPKSKKSP
jgi:hypothetical protein